MAVAAAWSIIALGLIRLMRLGDPRGQALVLVAPLLAAFIGRVRLATGFEWLLVAASIAIAAALLLRDTLVYRRTLSKIHAAASSDTRIEAIIVPLAARFSIAPPQLLITTAATQPFTSGVMRPVIVLPASIAESLQRKRAFRLARA